MRICGPAQLLIFAGVRVKPLFLGRTPSHVAPVPYHTPLSTRMGLKPSDIGFARTVKASAAGPIPANPEDQRADRVCAPYGRKQLTASRSPSRRRPLLFGSPALAQAAAPAGAVRAAPRARPLSGRPAPAPQRLPGDAKVMGELAQRPVGRTVERHRFTPELRRIRLSVLRLPWHGGEPFCPADSPALSCPPKLGHSTSGFHPSSLD